MAKHSQLAKTVFCTQFLSVMRHGSVTAMALCYAYAASDRLFNWNGFNRLMKEVTELLGVDSPYTRITSPAQLSDDARKLLVCL